MLRYVSELAFQNFPIPCTFFQRLCDTYCFLSFTKFPPICFQFIGHSWTVTGILESGIILFPRPTLESGSHYTYFRLGVPDYKVHSRYYFMSKSSHGVKSKHAHNKYQFNLLKSTPDSLWEYSAFYLFGSCFSPVFLGRDTRSEKESKLTERCSRRQRLAWILHNLDIFCLVWKVHAMNKGTFSISTAPSDFC